MVLFDWVRIWREPVDCHPTSGLEPGNAGWVLLTMHSMATGGAVRVVLELAGVRNCFGKQLGSANPLNNARATVEGLRALRTFKQVDALQAAWQNQKSVNMLSHCVLPSTRRGNCESRKLLQLTREWCGRRGGHPLFSSREQCHFCIEC